MITTHMDWNEYEQLISKLALEIDEYLIASGRATRQEMRIAGVPRGGLIMAVTLAHRLNFKYLDITDLKSAAPMHQILICDDVAATGETIERVIQRYCGNEPKATYVAVLVSKQMSQMSSRFMGKQEMGTWTVFPWECDRSPKRREGTV